MACDQVADLDLDSVMEFGLEPFVSHSQLVWQFAQISVRETCVLDVAASHSLSRCELHIYIVNHKNVTFYF